MSQVSMMVNSLLLKYKFFKLKLYYFGLDGSILKRSCYSELDASQKAVCDVDTNINCIKSSDSGNTQTKRVGNNCYKCEGAECVNPKAEHSIVCLAGTDGKSTSCYTGINGEFSYIKLLKHIFNLKKYLKVMESLLEIAKKTF